MALNKEDVSGSTVITFTGDFDAHAASEARPELEELLNQNGLKLVINLEHMKFIDSTGIGLLVYLYKKLSTTGGTLSLAGGTGQPAELIKVLKVDQVIRQYPDVKSACSEA